METDSHLLNTGEAGDDSKDPDTPLPVNLHSNISTLNHSDAFNRATPAGSQLCSGCDFNSTVK